MINRDTPDFSSMEKSGSILKETLRSVIEYIKPGLSTLQVSKKAEEVIRSYEGASPAFLGYKGFPGAACISVNSQMVHGVPKSSLILKEGDIISVDCGVLFQEHYTDACRTVGVGSISPNLRKLLKVTKDALDKGIEQAQAGNQVGDISWAVQRHVERNRLKVCYDFGGHGIGRILHDDPHIPNYGPPKAGEVLTAGQCLAIEPVVVEESNSWVRDSDNWTISSSSGKLSAHFEDTIYITEKGSPLILTR
jgi:methionyl aminopeptidase